MNVSAIKTHQQSPSKLAFEFGQKNLYVDYNRNEITYIGPGNSDQDVQTAIADAPVSYQYYFEVQIINAGASGVIGIGLCQPQVNKFRQPGWENNSYGYHGDDGKKFYSSGVGQPYGPTYTTHDVIGVLYSQMAKTITYFKNGQKIGVAFGNVQEDNLYPCVGLRSCQAKVKVNFGDQPFVTNQFNNPIRSPQPQSSIFATNFQIQSQTQIRACSDKDEFVVELLQAKKNCGKSFEQIAQECGLTNVYAAQLFYNQVQLKQDTAVKLKSAVPTLTNQMIEEMKMVPNRYYDEDIIQEPNIQRLHEALLHSGQSVKALINEKFGDGNLSSADFFMTINSIKGKQGEDRCVVILNAKFEPQKEQKSDDNTARLI
eukprot:TRINITY_DN199_c2_g1_i1.p1 TRINITY_DN199_c2_g1~~TRINITY_DN199_c2_g1_i1.p1  ORF type:complete len:372 (-),score=29.15 TRINITY_DN199_c2_g1_i1:202-1317(-)